MIKDNIFKAYDIRGIYPAEINEEVGFRVGSALIKFLKKKLNKSNLQIVVGRDCRLSSESLFKAFCQGVFSQKGTIIDIGPVSTDTLYFAISYFKYDGGVMITASHNPKDNNGFKMLARGQKFIYQDWGMNEIKKLVNKSDFKERAVKGRIIRKNVIPVYLGYILKLINLKDIKPLKVVVDAGNGMAGINIGKIAEKIPITLYPMYFKPNGNFSFRGPNPLIKKNVRGCQKKVIKKKADFGLVFDADGDRTVFIDESGKIIPGDIIIALFSQYFLKKYRRGKIVYDLICSKIVEEKIKEEGGYPLKTKTGRPFVRKKALENKVVFAGEKSGHLFFPEIFYSECGGLTFLTMIKILSKSEKTLSRLVRPFKKYHQLSADLKIEDKTAAIKKLSKYYNKGKKDWLDGLTVGLKNWWFNVRPSNTEPYLRLVVEAENKKTVQREFERIKKIIKRI